MNVAIHHDGIQLLIMHSSGVCDGEPLLITNLGFPRVWNLNLNFFTRVPDDEDGLAAGWNQVTAPRYTKLWDAETTRMCRVQNSSRLKENQKQAEAWKSSDKHSL